MGSMISTTVMKTSPPHRKGCEDISHYSLRMCLSATGGAVMTLVSEGFS